MKKTIFIVVFVIVLIILAGIIFTVSQKGDINMAITAEKAFDLITKNKDNQNFMILDVRTPEEYRSGYIAGAVNIDFNAADFTTRISQLDKNNKYLVYCRSANRSGQAVSIMKGLKFKEVYDLSGGIFAWSQQNYPLVKP